MTLDDIRSATGWKEKSASRHYAAAAPSCAYCTVRVRRATDSEWEVSLPTPKRSCVTSATSRAMLDWIEAKFVDLLFNS